MPGAGSGWGAEAGTAEPALSLRPVDNTALSLVLVTKARAIHKDDGVGDAGRVPNPRPSLEKTAVQLLHYRL